MQQPDSMIAASKTNGRCKWTAAVLLEQEKAAELQAVPTGCQTCSMQQPDSLIAAGKTDAVTRLQLCCWSQGSQQSSCK